MDLPQDLRAVLQVRGQVQPFSGVHRDCVDRRRSGTLEVDESAEGSEEEDLLLDVKGLSPEDQFNELGDHHPDFRYTL